MREPHARERRPEGRGISLSPWSLVAHVAHQPLSAPWDIPMRMQPERVRPGPCACYALSRSPRPRVLTYLLTYLLTVQVSSPACPYATVELTGELTGELTSGGDQHEPARHGRDDYTGGVGGIGGIDEYGRVRRVQYRPAAHRASLATRCYALLATQPGHVCPWPLAPGPSSQPGHVCCCYALAWLCAKVYAIAASCCALPAP